MNYLRKISLLLCLLVSKFSFCQFPVKGGNDSEIYRIERFDNGNFMVSYDDGAQGKAMILSSEGKVLHQKKMSGGFDSPNWVNLEDSPQRLGGSILIRDINTAYKLFASRKKFSVTEEKENFDRQELVFKQDELATGNDFYFEKNLQQYYDKEKKEIHWLLHAIEYKTEVHFLIDFAFSLNTKQATTKIVKHKIISDKTLTFLGWNNGNPCLGIAMETKKGTETVVGVVGYELSNGILNELFTMNENLKKGVKFMNLVTNDDYTKSNKGINFSIMIAELDGIGKERRRGYRLVEMKAKDDYSIVEWWLSDEIKAEGNVPMQFFKVNENITRYLVTDHLVGVLFDYDHSKKEITKDEVIAFKFLNLGVWEAYFRKESCPKEVFDKIQDFSNDLTPYELGKDGVIHDVKLFVTSENQWIIIDCAKPYKAGAMIMKMEQHMINRYSFKGK